MMKKIRNLTIGVFTLVLGITGFMYVNDFRYNNEDGLCYIVDRGSNYTEEEREEKGISKDYECRLTHIENVKTVVSILENESL